MYLFTCVQARVLSIEQDARQCLFPCALDISTCDVCDQLIANRYWLVSLALLRVGAILNTAPLSEGQPCDDPGDFMASIMNWSVAAFGVTITAPIVRGPIYDDNEEL